MRHAVYSALNKPRLLFGVDYRIFLLSAGSGLPILAFSHSRATMVAALALPVALFVPAAWAYRVDSQFLSAFFLGLNLRRRYDASKQ
jgi:hypothetical protein